MLWQTVTASGDTMRQHAQSGLAHPRKCIGADIECEAGCGVVPFRYREQSYVNVSDGDLVVQQRDAFLPSRGADFELVRTYNSRGKLGGAANWGWTRSTGLSL